MPDTPITKKQAYSIGGRKALRHCLFVFLIFEAFMIFVETREDFSNDILFFISRQSDPFTISFIIQALLFSFLFGRLAGKKILIDKKNPLLIALLFAFSITALLFGSVYVTANIYHIFLEQVPLFISILTAAQLAIWLPAAWAIHHTIPE